MNSLETKYSSHREYSRDHLKDRRLQLAQEIREKRRIDKKLRHSQAIRLESEVPNLEGKLQEQIQELERNQQALRRRADKMKLSWYEKVIGELNSRKSKRKRSREYVAEKEIEISELEQRIINTKSRIFFNTREILELRSGVSLDVKDQIDAKRETLARIADEGMQEHNRRVDKKQEEMEQRIEEAPQRQIGALLDKHDVYFAHAAQVREDIHPEENSLISRDVTWQDKIKLVAAMGPAISVSTIRPEVDNYKNVFAPVGVLLGGGEVVFASDRDANTVAIDDNTRIHSYHFNGPSRDGEIKSSDDVISKDTAYTLEHIDRVIERGPVKSGMMEHNELIVSEPAPCALFFHGDEIEDETEQKVYKVPDHDQIQNLAEELSLPVVIMVNGVAFHAVYDEQKKRFVKSEDRFETSDVRHLGGVPERVKSEIMEDVHGRIFERND